MDEGLRNSELLGQICDAFSIKPQNTNTYSPLALAFIGDGIFDLVIRTIIVARGNAPASALHDETANIVMAESQSELLKAVWEELSPEEQRICRRGRNAKPHTIAKNASMHDYRAATGLEALLGYLYLAGNMERVISIIRMGLSKLEKGYEQ